MLKILNENIYAFDIDDTLVMWGPKNRVAHKGAVEIVDPYEMSSVFLTPHDDHIRLLKQMHGRGRFIMVWSAGGVLWANAVIKELGLESYVDLVITKPIGYVDDLPAEKFLKNHIYLKFREQA